MMMFHLIFSSYLILLYSQLNKVLPAGSRSALADTSGNRKTSTKTKKSKSVSTTESEEKKEKKCLHHSTTALHDTSQFTNPDGSKTGTAD